MKGVQRLLLLWILIGVAHPVLAQMPPPPSGKLAWDLFQEALAGQHTRAQGEEPPTLTALLTSSQLVAESDLGSLNRLGYTVLGSYGRLVLVEALADLYVHPTRGIDVLDFVASASLAPLQLDSSTQSIGMAAGAIHADAAWAQGYRGHGQRVAVVDSGFDPELPELSPMAATYYLVTPSPLRPDAYSVLEGQIGEVSFHGSVCALIVGSVAPDAEILLISYKQGTSLVGWLCALDFAVTGVGAAVVTTSVEFSRPTCHADGTGPLNEAVSSILEHSEAVLVVSSGNWAAGSGSDRWFYRSRFSDVDGDYRHDFARATDMEHKNMLWFEASRGTVITVVLEWDDWGTQAVSSDLDLYLYDADYGDLLAQSRASQYGRTSSPYEHVRGRLPYTGRYALVVEDAAARWHGGSSALVAFHLNVHSSSGTFRMVDQHTVCGSIREIATSSEAAVIVVGAVDPESSILREYSSRGPISAGENRPLFLAPDGSMGTAYPVFHGTSASAPVVAGALALMRSACPLMRRSELLRVLRDSGIWMDDDCGNPVQGVDTAVIIRKLLLNASCTPESRPSP